MTKPKECNDTHQEPTVKEKVDAVLNLNNSVSSEADLVQHIEKLSLAELSSLTNKQYPISPITDEMVPRAIDFYRNELRFEYYKFVEMAQLIGVAEDETEWGVKNMKAIKDLALAKLENTIDHVHANSNFVIQKCDDAPEYANDLLNSCTPEDIVTAFKNNKQDYYFSYIHEVDEKGYPIATSSRAVESIGFTISAYPDIKNGVRANMDLAKLTSEKEWKLLVTLIIENDNFPSY